MAYTRAWDETAPLGTELANTLDTIIQHDKTDTRERIAGIFGMNLAQWTADPIVPISLTLSGALTGNVIGNVTGNLTGSVLTAAQPNITSLGNLTGLTVAGIAAITTLQTIGLGTIQEPNASDFTITAGASGSGNIDLVAILAGSIKFQYGAGVKHTFTNTLVTIGTDIRFANDNASDIGSGGARPRTITVATNLITPQLLAPAATALLFGITGFGNCWAVQATGHFAAITDNAFDIGNAGSQRPRNVYVATDITYGGNLNGGIVLAYPADQTPIRFSNTGAPADTKKVFLNVLTALGTIRLRAVNDAESNGFNAITITRTGITPGVMSLMPDGGTVSIFGATTFNNTVGGVTTLTATTVVANLTGNVTGTILTAAQANITSLGTLTALSVSGTADFGTGHIKNGASTSVTTITTILSGLLGATCCLVYGDDGAGNRFFDEVFSDSATTPPTVVHAVTLNGTPTGRTYSVASGLLKLAMASGTYTVKVFPLQVS